MKLKEFAVVVYIVLMVCAFQYIIIQFPELFPIEKMVDE